MSAGESGGREPVIELRDVTSGYGDTVVHRDVDLTVYADEVVGLVGGSGSGKSTLLKVMLGLLAPKRGEVRVLGRAPDATLGDGGASSAHAGVLFQGGALFSSLTVFDNVALPLRELGLDRRELLTPMVQQTLALVGLEPQVGARRPAELSGGMVKRAGLARALVLEPRLLYLDEPTSGLDPGSADAFVDLLAGLRQQLALSVVLISHDVATVADLCDRVAVIADSSVVAVDTPRAMADHPHPFAQRFFAGSRASRLLAGDGIDRSEKREVA